MSKHVDAGDALRRRPVPFLLRDAVAVMAAVALTISVPHAATAQGTKIEKGGHSERVVQTEDDWSIYITYYPSMSDKEAAAKETPVVILLHGDKDNRLVWEGTKGLAPRLQLEGFAVVTVDLRKHGQSTNVAQLAGDSPAGGKNTDGANLLADDYVNMVERDLPAVKKFIFDRHQEKRLNMNKMGIIAEESSAGVALCFADADWNRDPYDDAPTPELRTPRGQDVRAIVLLSPTQRTRGLDVPAVLNELKNPDWNVAFLTMYGKLNKKDEKDAIAVYHKLAGASKAAERKNEDRMYLFPYNFKLHGVELLGKKEVDAEATIVKFLKLHLTSLRESEWRDRQSRLTKK